MYLDRLEIRHDPLRRLDCRCRLLCAALLLAGIVACKSLLLPLAVILACAAALFRDFRVMIRRLADANLMVLALWLPVPFGLSAAGEALALSLRTNAAVLVCMVLLSPLGTGRLAGAMRWFRLPPKLVSLFLLVWRSIFLLYESVSVAVLSMRQRRGRGNLGEWKALGAVFATALVHAALRSERVSIAMKSRGFDGEFPVTTRYFWGPAETLSCAASLGFLILASALFRGFP